MSATIIEDIESSYRKLIEEEEKKTSECHVKVFYKTSYVKDEIYDEISSSEDKRTPDNVYNDLLLEDQGLTLGI